MGNKIQEVTSKNLMGDNLIALYENQKILDQKLDSIQTCLTNLKDNKNDTYDFTFWLQLLGVVCLSAFLGTYLGRNI